MRKPAMCCDVTRVALKFYESIGTPKSLSLAVMLREKDYDGISEFSLDPKDYCDAQSYALDCAAISFLKKYPHMPTTFDRSARAKEIWRQGERSCFASNERLNRYLPENRLSDDRVAGIDSFFESVRKIILSWIGPTPPELVEGRFGPGSTFSDRGDLNTVPDKMSSNPTLTRSAIWYLPQVLGTQWGASLAHRSGKFDFVKGNRFATVPKSSKIDRSIASEPSINSFFQLGLGRVLRKRLRNATGWDLSNAQKTHVQVARQSSVDRKFCTLDLSNASDTVSRTLVKVLLPPAWFDQLDSLRSASTLIDGKWVLLEKFSSMGNGFTFELETIIFAAIACSVARKYGGLGELGIDVFVFGDDIIVIDELFHPLKSVLAFCGFSVNDEKSFHGDSPFRESCGGDFFLGRETRGYYLKDDINEPQKVFSLANGIRQVTNRLRSLNADVGDRAWGACLDLLPSALRSLRGPKDLGDLLLHEADESRWRVRWKHGIRYVQCYRPVHRVKSYAQYKAEVVLACATYGCGNRGGGVIPRNSIRGYVVDWVPFS